MSFLTHAAVDQLTPSNFEAYVDGVLNNFSHRDAVIAELGISRFERPFFNSNGSDLDKSLVLSKLYDSSNGANPRPIFHPEDFTQIVRQLNGSPGAGRSQNWPGLRFIDLSYAQGSIGDSLWRTYGGVEGLGISQSQGDAMHTLRPTATHSHEQLPTLNVDILRAAERGTLGNNVVAGNYNLVLANASMLQAERPAMEEDRVRLIWAQLLLAFRYVSPGGSLVLSIDTRPHDWVVDVITVLTLTFNPNSIKVIPPRNHETKRPTAYILCRGYGSSGTGGLTNLFISRLGEALRNRNNPRPRISEITDQMIIGMQGHAYTAFMLLKPVWSIQYECVRARLRERLLQNPGSHV